MLPRVCPITTEQKKRPTNFIIVKYWIRIDDSMDVFAEHGVAGIVGLLFNALFGDDSIFGLDGVNTGTPTGGWVIHNWKQMYIQIAYIAATSAYAFVVSAIIAFAINMIPGLNLRASEEAELLGMDDDQLGEFAYDYVEVRRDYLAWTPQKQDQLEDGHEIPAAARYGIGEHSEMMLDGQPAVFPGISQDDYSAEFNKMPAAPRQVAEQYPESQEIHETSLPPSSTPTQHVDEKE